MKWVSVGKVKKKKKKFFFATSLEKVSYQSRQCVYEIECVHRTETG